jgi:DNA repair protein RadA/Sms
MSKPKRMYICQACHQACLQWAGQCAACQAWNSLIERPFSTALPAQSGDIRQGYAGQGGAKAQSVALRTVSLGELSHLSTGLSELDRVLGGGIIQGSVVLLGGDPGIGKSTLLLQMLGQLSKTVPSLYVTGEESLQQIALRAKRLGFLECIPLKALVETCVESILIHAAQEKAKILVIDSIQTLYTEQLNHAPGSVTQLRESTAYLTRYAKQSDTTIFLVGHVTKEGALAGPRVLEHIVDTVLYFEGEADHRFRLIRAVKNRFGPANELGVFAMTEKGLKEVHNPSAIFLSRPQQSVPGNLVTASWEGSRALLIELQALVDNTHLANPRRVTVGLDHNRLALLLAILHQHGGIQTYQYDVFVNVVGGVRLLETSADLPVLLAILSSLRNTPIPQDLLVFGEVGLSGEVRPIPNGQARLQIAANQGFRRAIIPKANMASPHTKLGEMQLIPVSLLTEALDAL